MEYGLIGHPVKQSFSQEVHAEIAKVFKHSYSYGLLDIPDGKALDEFLKKKEFKAVNVTLPYKKAVLPYLDSISEEAKSIGAVNVIVNKGGKLCGDNSDYYGLKDLILRSKEDFKGKSALILGTGGTSNTAYTVLTDLGCSPVYKVSRTKKGGALSYEEAKEKGKEISFIVNATPCGMFPYEEDIPLCPEDFPNLKGAFDVIYHPLRTNFILEAQKRGVYSEGGLYMLVAQAFYAYFMFFGKKAETNPIDPVFRKILKERENIVLIGMPSSGKSTLGKIVADRLHRPFFDVDTEIEKKIGKSIADYFKDHTEKEFRDVEEETVKEISALSKAVIATGGGSVLRPINVKRLKRDGKLFYLDRPVEKLVPTASRPLSSSIDALYELYNRRRPLYEEVKDVLIDASKEIDEVAEEIVERR